MCLVPYMLSCGGYDWHMASVFFKLTVNPMIETNALLLSHATIQKNITLNYDIYNNSIKLQNARITLSKVI